MTEAGSRRLRWSIAVVVASAVVCAGLDRSEASLASAPFTVSVAVSSDASGNRVTVSVEPRPGQGRGDMEPFDLYIAQLQGFQDAIFLTASNSWSPRPASLRQGVLMAKFAPVVVRWSEPRIGSLQLLVIAARASSEPLVSSNWLFRPVLRNVAVRTRLADAPDRWQASLILCFLGALTLAAVGVVVWLPGPRGSSGA
jgi:hypothetical protein